MLFTPTNGDETGSVFDSNVTESNCDPRHSGYHQKYILYTMVEVSAPYLLPLQDYMFSDRRVYIYILLCHRSSSPGRQQACCLRERDQDMPRERRLLITANINLTVETFAPSRLDLVASAFVSSRRYLWLESSYILSIDEPDIWPRYLYRWSFLRGPERLRKIYWHIRRRCENPCCRTKH
jgi:hypothetical protein